MLRVCTDIYVYVHACMCIHAHACDRTRVCTCTVCVYAHACAQRLHSECWAQCLRVVHMHMCAHTHTCVHAHTCAHARLYANARMCHAYVHTYPCMCMCAYRSFQVVQEREMRYFTKAQQQLDKLGTAQGDRWTGTGHEQMMDRKGDGDR